MSCEIIVERAVLRYPISRLEQGSIKELLLGTFAPKAHTDTRLSRAGEVEALRGVSFRVKDGERFAILGPNGSGKTTLLKALGGVYPLASGTITVKGHIQSLIDISLGFEGDATGRENILYRGLIMGLTPRQIRVRTQDIIDFADLGEFIDLPLRSYSAGMAVRLAFAVSTYLEGDILLLDEFLGAGDAAFQAKAQARMASLVDGARILVLATHSMELAEKVCQRAILLDRGEVVAEGPPKEVAQVYRERLAKVAAAAA